MPSPFPGMDPYLEGPFWSSFHAQFCAEIARRLTPALSPRYIALVEERLVIDSLDDIAIATRTIRPDVTVLGDHPAASGPTTMLQAPMQLAAHMEQELPMHFVEIREVASMVVVTVLELLSPANKQGEGRTDYLRKRRLLLNSDTNLIEIDLLRGGQRVPMRESLPDYPYFVLVHRAANRPLADIWPIRLPDPLPVIPVPLLHPDPDVKLDLQLALAGAYASADYSRIIDYTASLDPSLAESDAIWVASILASKKDRGS